MHVHLLENPSAGRDRTRPWLEAFVKTLQARGTRVTRVHGLRPGDLARHVETLGPDEADTLFLVGGDGTLRSVLNARELPFPWPLGVLPFGTANLVAREAGTLPLPSPEAAAGAFLEATPWPVDLLEFRRPDGPVERAITTVSAGLDGAIVHAVAEVRANGKGGGYTKWVGPILSSLGDSAFQPIQVTVDDGPPTECMTVVVQNTRCYGGLFRLSPEARLDTGRAEVVTMHAGTRRDLVRLGLRATIRSIHRDRHVGIQRGQRVRLTAPRPVSMQADGDPAGFTDVEVRVRPGTLRLLKAARLRSGRRSAPKS